MKKVLFCVWLGCLGCYLQGETDLPAEEIIKRFAAKEAEFREVWRTYTYSQHIVFQVLNRSGDVREQREVRVEVYFTREGERKTRIVEDRGHLESVQVSQEDMDDATQRQPFVLTSDELDKYKIKYKGKETVDELGTYVFEVKPRKINKGNRYFKGRIWVDDLDFQIVMTRGKIVPDYSNNKFPEFETVRQQIDGQYWFPTWTKAEDVLEFGSFMGQRRRVHVREFITYEDFQKFEVNTSIQYEPVEKN